MVGTYLPLLSLEQLKLKLLPNETGIWHRPGKAVRCEAGASGANEASQAIGADDEGGAVGFCRQMGRNEHVHPPAFVSARGLLQQGPEQRRCLNASWLNMDTAAECFDH